MSTGKKSTNEIIGKPEQKDSAFWTILKSGSKNWRILKKTIPYSGFKNTYKKIRDIRKIERKI